LFYFIAREQVFVLFLFCIYVFDNKRTRARMKYCDLCLPTIALENLSFATTVPFQRNFKGVSNEQTIYQSMADLF